MTDKPTTPVRGHKAQAGIDGHDDDQAVTRATDPAEKWKALLAFIVLLLTSCGELPQDQRDREQREETIRWLERQELKRQQ